MDFGRVETQIVQFGGSSCSVCDDQEVRHIGGSFAPRPRRCFTFREEQFVQFRLVPRGLAVTSRARRTPFLTDGGLSSASAT
jgi:hypothetical protein